MGSQFLIDVVTKPHRTSDDKLITHLGNRIYGWRLTKESVAQRILSGESRFFVIDVATEKRHEIFVEADGDKLTLKAHNGAQWMDTLMALPLNYELPVID